MTERKPMIVVIPARNEAGRIGAVIRSVRDVLDDVPILVVNDDSTDATAAEAREAGARVISHPVNLGYGAALETGYQYSLRRGYDVIVQMDADGQHLPEEIPRLIGPVLGGEADFTVGSRFLAQGRDYRATVLKNIGHRIFSVMYSLLTGYRLTDPTSGFQCLNRRVVNLFAACRFPDDFPDVDVLLIAHYAGFRMREVPVRMRGRSGGRSMHSGLRPLYYVIKMILSVFLVILSRRRWKYYVS